MKCFCIYTYARGADLTEGAVVSKFGDATSSIDSHMSV